MVFDNNEPRYVISIAASMIGVRTHTLRYYEKIGVVQPSRSRGNTRLYSDRDVAQLRQMKSLMEDLGVNLAGVEIILRMSQHIAELKRHIEELELEVKRLREENEP